jgi:hypothetical protein
MVMLKAICAFCCCRLGIMFQDCQGHLTQCPRVYKEYPRPCRHDITNTVALKASCSTNDVLPL